jgi:hypothetical protein
MREEKARLEAERARAAAQPTDEQIDEQWRKRMQGEAAEALSMGEAQRQANFQRQVDEDARQKAERAAELVTLADMIGDRISEKLVPAIVKAMQHSRAGE